MYNSRFRIGIILAIGCLLIVPLLLAYKAFDLIANDPQLGPPTITRSTLRLAKGVNFQVQEVCNHGLDDDVYEYTFTHAGQGIGYSWEWNESLPTKIGHLQNASYFFQRKLICIYYSPKNKASYWTTWDMSDPDFALWWTNSLKVKGGKWSSDSTQYDWTGFSIEKFVMRGNVWIIIVSKSLVPDYVHVVSVDFGRTWNIHGVITTKYR